MGAGAALVLAACAAPAAPTATPAPAAPAAKATDAPAAAAATKAPAAQVQEIHVYAIDRDQDGAWYKKAYADDVDGFKTKNPNIKVDLQLIPGYTETYWPKIMSLASTGSPMDIVWYPALHGEQHRWAANYHIVQPLDDLAKAANYDPKANFLPASITSLSHEGKLYWFNLTGEPSQPCVVFNKTAIAKAGLEIPMDEKEDPLVGQVTWDDFYAWAKKGTEKGGGVFGYMPPGPYSIGDVHFWRQYGFEMIAKDGATLDFPKEQGTAWLHQRSDPSNKDKFSPPQKSDATTLFLQGQTMSSVIWPVFLASMPDLVKGKFEIDFRQVPVLKKGDKRRSVLNQHIYGVCDNRFSKFPQAAFSYLQWISGKEATVQGVLAGMSACVARTDFWNDQRVFDKRPGFLKIKELMLQGLEPDIVIKNWRGDQFNMGTYVPLMQKLIIGEATPEQTYDAIAAQIPPVLKMSPA